LETLLYGGEPLNSQAEDTADDLQHVAFCACDTEKYGVWGIAASAVLYVGFALFQEYVNGGNKRIVYIREDKSERLSAQADEVQTTHQDSTNITMAEKTQQVETVKFVDTHPGFTHEQKGSFDSVRDHAFIQDARLEDYFKRPVRIHTTDWTPGVPMTQATIDPWSLFFNDPKVINRLNNYRLMRCKLHIKAIISGTPFHYGRAMLDYLPLPTLDDITSIRNPYLDADYVLVTQRPHIMLDPVESQGGEMILPFFYTKDALDIVTAEWSEMGRLTLSEFSTLLAASSTTDPVTIQIFAWAEDLKFAIPTEYDAATLSAQADEYSARPVSYIAGAVATLANSLKSVPTIGPFARATEIGARGIGAMATLFGYSRPVEIETRPYKPKTKMDLAVTNTKDDAAKLSVDVKQELTIDPRIAGLDDVDEMGINYIAQKESYVGSFLWSTNNNPEDGLWTRVVDPGTNVTNVETQTAYYLPAVAFAALPFKYWRGSLKYRFQVVASKYHRGRVRIVYDPVGYLSTSSYNGAYSTIIDIAETRDFTITVGWGQTTTYREVAPPDAAIVHSTYNSTTVPYGNGSLSMYVVNELAHPDVTANVEVKVFVSAGDDFELAVPTSEYLKQMTVNSLNNKLKPQALELNLSSQAEEVMHELKPTGGVIIDQHAGTSQLSDPSNLVYFGESIRSYRSLLKRYNLSRFLRFPNSPVGVYHWWYRIFAFPPYPQKYATPGRFTFTDGDLDTRQSGLVTLLNYISIGYVGWRGSLRLFVDLAADNLNGTNGVSNVCATLEHIASTYEDYGSQFLTSSTKDVVQAYYDYDHGHDGKAFEASGVQPTLSVEVPYYNNNRFSPTRSAYVPTTIGPDNSDNQRVLLTGDYATAARDDAWAKIHVATGEDFNLFFYIGPPRLFMDSNIA
jgi:hypothetical protein